MNSNKYKIKLTRVYNNFFKKIGINKKTGQINSKKNKKFPAYPFIGSKYGKTKKILVIGLDIGKDPKEGGVLSLEERREIIEDKKINEHKSPYLPGVYISALYFLKKEKKWNKNWNNVKFISFQKALKKPELLPKENPLSFIAFTNFFKFVTIYRKRKSGNKDRTHINKKKEEQLLIDEVKILNPDIILFHSKSFSNKKEIISKLKKFKNKIFIGPHPSYHGKKESKYFINQYEKLK